MLLSVLSPGHCCAPEDASIKIPVLSAKWRGSLETFYSPLSKLSGRQKFSQLWFWGLYQRQIFGTDSWQNVKISSDTSHVDVNDIHRLQHLDNVKGNFIDSDNVKPTYIHPKQGSAPKGVPHPLRSTWQISSLLAKHALSNCVCVYTQIYIHKHVLQGSSNTILNENISHFWNPLQTVVYSGPWPSPSYFASQTLGQTFYLGLLW